MSWKDVKRDPASALWTRDEMRTRIAEILARVRAKAIDKLARDECRDRGERAR